MKPGCANPKTGLPKYRFKTRSTAKRFLRRLRDDGRDDGMQAYRCEECGWFHVGHYPSNPTTRAERRAKHRQDTTS